jgi:hypothetical protein
MRLAGLNLMTVHGGASREVERDRETEVLQRHAFSDLDLRASH